MERHTFPFSIAFGVGAALLWSAISHFGRSHYSNAALVITAALIGTTMGLSMFLGTRPVPRDRVWILATVLAVAGWLIGIVTGASLFVGGFVILFVMSPAAWNVTGLTIRGRIAAARSAPAQERDG